MACSRLSISIIILILAVNILIFFQFSQVNIISKFQMHQTRDYSYYVCTQVMNESEAYLIEWIEYQLNVVGFKNICLINAGESFNPAVLSRYAISVIHKKEKKQEFNRCLSCFDQSMKPSDLLFIQDIDEFLNVRQADVIAKNYDQYDKFHFHEIRYGYVHDTDREMKNKSLLETNVYRKPHEGLGEYNSKRLKDLFDCQTHHGWYSCDEGYGKEMIKVGKIQQLETHFHRSNRNDNRTKETLYVDMKDIRLHHYIMRTRENGLQKGVQWDKYLSRIGVINSNAYFKMIFDDTIRDSQRLL